MENGNQRDIGRIEGKLDGILIALGEVKGDIVGLRTDFGTMEKGRLSKLEVQFATLYTEIETKAKSSSIWYSAIMSVAGSIVSGIILFLLLH